MSPMDSNSLRSLDYLLAQAIRERLPRLLGEPGASAALVAVPEMIVHVWNRQTTRSQSPGHSCSGHHGERPSASTRMTSEQGLIFLKYISDAFQAQYHALTAEKWQQPSRRPP